MYSILVLVVWRSLLLVMLCIKCLDILFESIKFSLINIFSYRNINNDLVSHDIAVSDMFQELVTRAVRPHVWQVLFVQFILVETIFVQPHSVQRCFRPTLDLSNLLSSKTYNRPFCFCLILVHFLFMSKKNKS